MNHKPNFIKLAIPIIAGFFANAHVSANTYWHYNQLKDSVDTRAIYSGAAIETKPRFPGNDQAFRKYIKKHFCLSQSGINAGVKGSVILSFVVERDGSLSNFKILRDLMYGTGEEAIRVLKVSPRWQAGKHKGVVVRSNFTLAVPVNI